MERTKMLSKSVGYLYFCAIGFLFVFCWKTGRDLAEWRNIVWNAQYTWLTLGISLVFGSLLGSFLAFINYAIAEKRYVRSERREVTGRIGNRINTWIGGLSEGQFFLISLILILASWLPTYLAYYPGICAYDTPTQTEQIVNNSYTDHHPILHTLIIKGAMYLGSNVLGDTNRGIAIYIGMQMILLALAMSYGLLVLHRFQVKTIWQIIMLVLCMFYPFHWYMSVSLTKDPVFTAFVLFFLIAMSALLLEGRNSMRPGHQDAILMIGALGIVLFRNNGKYALLVTFVFLMLMIWRGKESRKIWTRLMVCCCSAFLVGNLGLSLLFQATDAEQGNRREMLSIPIQQLARCMRYHGGVGILPEDDNSMDEEDRALINDYILDGGYRYYIPSLADPVKSYTYTSIVRYRTGDFLRTYFRLLSKYPDDFINAFLAVNAGFLYPNDTSHTDVYAYMGYENLGYVQTRWEEALLNERGIYKDSGWLWFYDKLENWAAENAYLNIPVLKYLFVPGVFLWFYLIYLGNLLIRRKFRMCLPLSFVAGYYVTMLMGPTVQLRYIYPVMVVLPFLILLSGTKKDLDA